MKKYQLGFIGCGNMGRAMMSGALEKEWTTAERVVIHTHHKETMDTLAAQYGVAVADSNRALAENADIIVLAVKPNIYADVLADVR